MDKMKLQKMLPVLACFVLFLLTISPDFTDGAISNANMDSIVETLKGFKEILGYVTEHPEWFKRHPTPTIRIPACKNPKPSSCYISKKRLCYPLVVYARSRGYTSCAFSAAKCCFSK